MSKSGLLYGLPNAIRGTGPVVLVEGVTDVWRLGRDAVATFGKTLSVRQTQQMVALFEARPIVVAYDADASEQSRKACSQLRSGRQALGDEAPVVIATLPRRYEDIGDCSRKIARKIVNRAVNTNR
jgi:DNA primase